MIRNFPLGLLIFLVNDSASCLHLHSKCEPFNVLQNSFSRNFLDRNSSLLFKTGLLERINNASAVLRCMRPLFLCILYRILKLSWFISPPHSLRCSDTSVFPFLPCSVIRSLSRRSVQSMYVGSSLQKPHLIRRLGSTGYTYPSYF